MGTRALTLGRRLAGIALGGLIAACSSGDGATSGQPNMPALASGQLDATYGSSGKVALEPTAYYPNVVVDKEGNAFVAAWTLDASQGYVLKLDASGAVATAYGTGGRSVVSPGGAWMGAMTIDATGNLYAGTADLGVVQFDPAGHRVASVGSPVVVPLPAALVRLSDGTFYVALIGGGLTGQTLGSIFKFDRNGRLEGVSASSTGGVPVLVADEPHGALYVAYMQSQTGGVFVDKLDLGTKAVTRIGAGVVGSCGGAPVGMDVDRAGNVYVATTCVGGATIWKFDPLGQLVGAFGNGGSRTGIFGPVSHPSSSSAGLIRIGPDAGVVVRVGPDGSVYVGGATDQGGCYKLTIGKMDSDGRDVTAFGSGGRLLVDVPDSTAIKIELDGNGRLYALGASSGTCPPASGARPSYFMVRAGA